MKLVDLHIHIDGLPKEDGEMRWHGSPPNKVAQALFHSPLAAACALEHGATLRKRKGTSFQHFFETQAHLEHLTDSSGGTRRKIELLMGMELAVLYEGIRYHVGIVFEGSYHAYNTPAIPDHLTSLRVIHEEYLPDYPALLLLFHPTWKDESLTRQAEVTEELIREASCFDGVELINGAMLGNGRKIEGPHSALGLTCKAAELFMESPQSNAALGCSDDHKTDLIGSVATGFEEGEGIFEAIRERRTYPVLIHSRAPVTLRDRVERLKSQVSGMESLIRTIE